MSSSGLGKSGSLLMMHAADELNREQLNKAIFRRPGIQVIPFSAHPLLEGSVRSPFPARRFGNCLHRRVVGNPKKLCCSICSSTFDNTEDDIDIG